MKLLGLAVLVAGCSSLGGKPAGPTELPTCTTYEACRAQEGERVQVIGVYEIWEPRPVPRELSRSRVVKLWLDGTEHGPYLERARRRPASEIARFRGKRVRVIGRYLRDLRTHADDTVAQLSGSTVIDIESITLAERAHEP